MAIPEPHAAEFPIEMDVIFRKLAVVLWRQQRGELAGERVEQVDCGALPVVDQNEESFRGEGEHLVVLELRDVNLHALAGGRVQEGAAVRQREFLAEHGPPPGMEPAVESALHARVSGAPSPGGADGSEAHVVRDVAGEDAVGDQPSRPVPEICPVPLQGRRGAGIHGAAGLGGVVAVGNVDNRGRGGATRRGRGRGELGLELFRTEAIPVLPK